MKKLNFEIVVIGAGPAGLAAASAASSRGANVAIVDENPQPGGQIWRGGPAQSRSAEAKSWFERLGSLPGLTRLCSSRIIAPLGTNSLLVETPNEAYQVSFERLVVATGARELFVPFPGWTLSGVSGAGGLQALVKGGVPVAGKRVVVAGSGPLLLAVAAYLVSKGARVSLIAEQTSWKKLGRFSLQLPFYPRKTRQALGLGRKLRGVAYKGACQVEEARGHNHLEEVVLKCGNNSWVEKCDYLACGFGLVPNLELSLALGCTVKDGVVQVNEWQQTTQANIYAAGEITGIGGLELSLLEGQIAGLAVIGQTEEAGHYFKERARARRFATVLQETFALRSELRQSARPDTIICRCEDVRYEDLERYSDWRSAKLQTRCGMGPCQGRICGAATSFLFGWEQGQPRPPLRAARLGSLALLEAEEK